MEHAELTERIILQLADESSNDPQYKRKRNKLPKSHTTAPRTKRTEIKILV